MANQPQDMKAFKGQVKFNSGAPPPKGVTSHVSTQIKGPMRHHMKNSGVGKLLKSHNARTHPLDKT